MLLYLAATPDKLHSAARFTRTLAHVAYRLDQNGQLLRQNLLRTHGGLMVLSDGDCRVIRDMPQLCRDIWRECGNREFAGIAADFEQPFRQDFSALLGELSSILSRNGRQLFVPECYGERIGKAVVLICTAISGGSLRHRLIEARQRFGPRLALDLQRLRMSFPLPCPSGVGDLLSSQELKKLQDGRQATTFYSTDLCAKYLTVTHNGHSRFILFDDGSTLLKKIQTGENLGITTGFLMYPEVEDLLPQIFPTQKIQRSQHKKRDP